MQGLVFIHIVILGWFNLSQHIYDCRIPFEWSLRHQSIHIISPSTTQSECDTDVWGNKI